MCRHLLLEKHLNLRHHILVVLSLCLAILCFQGDSAAQMTQTVTYEADDSVFYNPDRGWFWSYIPTNYNNSPAPPVTVQDLADLHAEHGITLIRKYYLLYPYKTQNLPQSVLDELTSDMAACREAGFKIAVRFSYNWNVSFDPGGSEDAPLAWTLQHIDQLRPILHANSDVLHALEAGFVGLWGEWHNSSNNHVDNYTLSMMDSGRQILDAVMTLAPPERMVAVRYPEHNLMALYSTPLDASQAYTGTNQARLGNHNDGFARDETEFGTFRGLSDPARSYIQQQTRYTIQTGEFGGDTEYARNNVILYSELYNYVSLNAYQTDSLTLMDWLYANGGYDLLAKKLGYRFRLISSEIPLQCQAGTIMQITLVMTNDGWARPHNPRDIELVLRNTANGHVVRMLVIAPIDERLFLPGQGETQELILQVNVPHDTAAGVYELLLNLPDPDSRLNTRAEYSIRLANQNTWEPVTGYNRLQADITVTSSQVVLIPPNPTVPTAIDGNSIEITWPDLSTDETGYIIQRKPLQRVNEWHNIADLPPDSTSYTDTNGIHGLISYTYRVGVYGE